MKLKSWMRRTAAAALVCSSFALAADAPATSTATEAEKAKALKGKKVAFIPIAMGFDLTEGWAAVMRHDAKKYGFSLTIKDPNWSTDQQLQAMSAVMAEKPDIIIAHNTNLQLLAKSLQKAEKAGIPVVQLNMPSAYKTDAYIGVDWVDLGRQTGERVVEECSKKKGKSGKVAVIQGMITDAASVFQLQGFNEALAKHPGEVEVVTNQPAEWDASKAKNVSETIVQQYKDLCGVFGMWDVMMKGAGETIKAASAGRPEPIKVFTSGGGTTLDCNGIKSGIYHTVWVYNVPKQARAIMDATEAILMSKSKPGSKHETQFTQLVELNKTSMTEGSCWDLETLKKQMASAN